MGTQTKGNGRWKNCRIGITGANGALGQELTKKFRNKGAAVIGLTHKQKTTKEFLEGEPNEWVEWECGKEQLILETLKTLDILILNHGINPKGKQVRTDIDAAIEVNALSTWRLIGLFEKVAEQESNTSRTREIWVNTSEAEIQPALSPAYEISKKLIGELVSVRLNTVQNKKNLLIFRKLILGPFLSQLNPIGIMPASLVANQIISQAEFNIKLIIVSPNPITYILMPITELIRSIYIKLVNLIYK